MARHPGMSGSWEALALVVIVQSTEDKSKAHVFFAQTIEFYGGGKVFAVVVLYLQGALYESKICKFRSCKPVPMPQRRTRRSYLLVEIIADTVKR